MVIKVIIDSLSTFSSIIQRKFLPGPILKLAFSPASVKIQLSTRICKNENRLYIIYFSVSWPFLVFGLEK
jgi:hypothetical protein